ncbi:ATP-binding protein [Runella sp.]|uniref:ATP-binding protein n=1 Tax=Runella sp. TaxID=1960881 RepID=UPI003D102940
MIQRQITQQIITDLSYFPAVGIIGPRQVGKTTLARWLEDQLSKTCIYLDMEDESDHAKLQSAGFYLESHADKCVIIDEIQLMPQLFGQLRSLIDRQREPARFILLGSASPSIIKNSSETLAGRIAYSELTPFSIEEVFEQTSIQTHWLRGGFPNALFAPTDQLMRRWTDNFIETFLQRDLQSLGYEIPQALMRNLLTMLTQVNGNILNVSDLSRSIGISQPTVSKYLDILEGSFLITRLQPYFANISKRLVKSPKLYIRDSGILHRLAKINSYEELLGNLAVGGSWEGYAIEQIRRTAGPDWQFFYYRTQVGAEIDLLLITPSGKKVGVEIKLTNAPTLSRGFYESRQDLSLSQSYVVVPESEFYQKDENVWVTGLMYFLKEIMSTFK